MAPETTILITEQLQYTVLYGNDGYYVSVEVASLFKYAFLLTHYVPVFSFEIAWNTYE